MQQRLMVLVVLSFFFIAGCAGLMMDVKDASKQNADVTLDKGATVSVLGPDVSVVQDELGEEEAQRVSRLIQKNFEGEVERRGLELVKTAENTVKVRVTNFEDGCGFCRGFFPFFGLGNSYLDARVELNVGSGRRRSLIVQKTGQASGLAKMGDQTNENAGYLAEVSFDAFMPETKKKEE